VLTASTVRYDPEETSPGEHTDVGASPPLTAFSQASARTALYGPCSAT